MIFDFSLPNNFAKDSPKKDLALPEGANGLVVHCCCAPCSTSLVECLIFNKIKPLMFFYNPNIYPLEEYEKRRDEWIHLCELLELDYFVGDYDYKKWQEKVKGLENEPERGNRCLKRYKILESLHKPSFLRRNFGKEAVSWHFPRVFWTS